VSSNECLLGLGYLDSSYATIATSLAGQPAKSHTIDNQYHCGTVGWISVDRSGKRFGINFERQTHRGGKWLIRLGEQAGDELYTRFGLERDEAEPMHVPLSLLKSAFGLFFSIHIASCLGHNLTRNFSSLLRRQLKAIAFHPSQRGNSVRRLGLEFLPGDMYAFGEASHGHAMSNHKWIIASTGEGIDLNMNDGFIPAISLLYLS